MTKTYILGKDKALEDSIDFFHSQLEQLGLSAKIASTLNPVPNVWSIHIQNLVSPLCFTNGKGATEKAAYASALGEYFERLSTHYFFSDFYLGEERANRPFVHYPSEKWFPITDQVELPIGILTEELWEFFDPDNELTPEDLIDLPSSHTGRGICTLPFISQKHQETVYVPVNLLANLYASNGMSAGNTLYEARVQALSEIFERYVKNRILTEAISLPEIPETILNRYPSIKASIATLENEGYPISCFDASLGGQFPVICVILFNPQNSTCYASFGAHPNFEVALERTVTELLQGRKLNELDVFSPPSFDNDEVADLSNLETHFIDSSGLLPWDLFKATSDFPFVHWDFSGTTEHEYHTLLDLMNELAIDTLIMDYQHLGVYACRILAVGVSEIYPPEDLLMANNNMAISWREIIQNLPDHNLSPEEYLAIIEQLDDDGLDDFARVRELLGLATGKDNGWYTLRIGELKAMLALAGDDLEQAREWIEWTLEVNESVFSSERLKFYRCLHTLVLAYLERGSDKFSDYLTAFNKMFGDTIVKEAKALIDRETAFYGLFSIDGNLTQLGAHQQLLSVYDQLHHALTLEQSKI